jgi:hypothetical protein
MTPLLIAVGKYTRDLLPHPESLIKFGRENFDVVQFDEDFILIDTLDTITPVAFSESFDETAERMTYQSYTKRSITMDFYGLNAQSLATKFRMLNRSQLSRDLQKQYGVSIFGATRLVDVKQLTGKQYTNRVQVEFLVHYNEVVNVDTLRIDTEQLEFLIN